MWLILLIFLLNPVLSFAQVDRWSSPPRYALPKTEVTVTGTATLVCPTNDNRVNCTCRNLGAEAVRYGDSTVTASTGAQIAAGEPVEIRIRGAVYMISEGDNTAVACTEETY